MPIRPETHLFNTRLLIIALLTVVMTVIVLTIAYASIDFVLQSRELVNIATNPAV